MKTILNTKFNKLASGVGVLALMATQAVADQVILDDLIVDGSACVGFDCVNGESFSFDTLRLKENNLRIHFDDTSTTASFAQNDWRLIANDTSNGGLNYLGIEDSTAGRIPFRVEAGARANALYVDDAGRVGLGTASPTVRMHLKDGNTPTVRLEQDGTSGFTAQTWDLAGNEANFFIRDATSGSTLPFRVFPGASSNALVIASDDDIGIGLTNPSAPLHVQRSDGTAKFLIEEASSTIATRNVATIRNNGGVYFEMEDTSIAAGNNTGRIWNIQNVAGEFRLTTAPGGAAEKELVLDADGNLTINGEITTSGSCSGGCDLVFAPDYDLPSIDEHAAMMWENRYLPSVGATAESGPMNLSLKVGGMLNELEKAHIYIEQLDARINELETLLDQQEG